MSMKNCNDTFGNRTCDLLTCSTVPQPTAPPCTPKVKQSQDRPGQTLRVPASWGSQISRQSAHEGGKVVSPTHWPPLSQQIYLVFISVTGWVNSRATIRNHTRDLSACSTVPQPTAPPHAPLKNTQISFDLPLISMDFISTGFPWCTSIPIVFHWRTFWPAFSRTVCCFHSPSRVSEGQRYSFESLIDWHWSFWA